MSSVINPVGPEDPGVYWRRRALVGGIALVVLFLFWLIFLRPGGDEPPEAAPVAAESSVAATGATDGESASPTPDGSGESPSPDPSGLESGTCAEDDILVTVETDAGTYAAGENPQISMSIQNTGDTACSRNIGSDANTIEITSGGVAVWSSDDCQEPGSADVQTLDSGKVATLSVTWDRTVSSGGCNSQPEAAAGFYDVVGKNLGAESREVSFTLE